MNKWILVGQAPLRVVEEGSNSPSSPAPLRIRSSQRARTGTFQRRDEPTRQAHPKQLPKPPLKGRDVTVMPSDGRHSGLPAGLSVPINKIRERAKGAI